MKKISAITHYLIPICMGILVFSLVAGFRSLDPTSLASFQYSDNFQHHLSSVFYRNSPWSFPIGLNPQYGLIESSTLVYADPVPLMAVLFKLAKPWIPATYQYLGIWSFLCLILQACFAWKLMSLLTPSKSLKALGTGFFLFVPSLLIRVGMHAALVGQFLLLAALYLRLSKRRTHTGFYWVLLLAFCASINFYIFFLVFIIWITDLLDRSLGLHELKIVYACREFLIGIAVVIFVFWQFGYFVGKTDSIAAGGFGFYQMNLLGPFDPQGWSYLFKRLTPPPPTIEGFLYFGLGIFALAPFAILKKAPFAPSYSQLFSQYRFLTLALTCLFLLAISNRILLGKYLFEFSLPAPLLALGGVVRSSGRMFWPIAYLLIFLLLALVIKKFTQKQAQWILAFALLVQIIDTSAGWLQIRATINQPSTLGNEVQFNSPFWHTAANHYKKVISLVPQKLFDESWNWIPVAKFAADNGMGTNSAYLSRIVPLENRPIHNAINEANFNKGKVDKDALYILSEQKILPAITHMDPQKDLLAKIDGMVVLAPNYRECSACPTIAGEMDIYKSVKSISVNQTLLFDRPSGYAYLPYLLEGWAYPENWGTWSSGKKSVITLPIPQGKSRILELKMRALVTPSHPVQRVKIWVNGAPVKTVSLTQDNNNFIEIPITDEARQESYLIIGLMYEDATTPQILGLGDDIRTLSIGLISGIYKN